MLVYSAESAVNRRQAVLFRFSRCFVLSRQKLYVPGYGCIYLLAALVPVCVDLMVMPSAYAMT